MAKLKYKSNNQWNELTITGAKGDSVTNAEIVNGNLIIHIGVLQPDGTILDTPVNVGRVVGQDGAQGQHGDGYTAAQIDANGDLIMTEIVYSGDNYSTRQVNLGHVVGAPGAPGANVADVTVNQQGHLIITLSDGTTIDAGWIGIPQIDISNAVVTLSTDEFIYDGNQKIPSIRSVTLHGTALIKNQDYVVISPPETAIGDYLLIIQGIGNYSGTSSASWSIKAQERYVFGVMWDYSLSSPQLSRLTPQNDPLTIVTNVPSQEPTACIGNNGSGQSEFDNYMPWRGMRRYNYIDGQIVDFIDYQSGETFVYIPTFWSKIVDDSTNNRMYFYISSAEISTFVKHHGSGRYVSRYECNDNFLSASGFMPKKNTSMSNFREGITAIDSIHYQYDIHTYSAIELLYIVEFANLNSQEKIGPGITSGGVAQITGQTDILTHHTGRALGTDNRSAIQYRWVENLWGNVWNYADGILIYHGEIFICDDETKYSNLTSNVNYKDTGLTVVTTNGFIKAKFPYINSYLFPSVVGGSDSTYMCDRLYYYDGNRCLYVGGNYNEVSSAGLFYWNGNDGPNDAREGTGGRSILILSSGGGV